MKWCACHGRLWHFWLGVRSMWNWVSAQALGRCHTHIKSTVANVCLLFTSILCKQMGQMVRSHSVGKQIFILTLRGVPYTTMVRTKARTAYGSVAALPTISTKSRWPFTCIFIWLCPQTFLLVVCKHVPEVKSPFVLILVRPKRLKGHLMTMIGAYDCTAIVSVPRLVLKWMSFTLNSLDHCKGAPPWTGAWHPRWSTAVGQLPALRLVYWVDPRWEYV